MARMLEHTAAFTTNSGLFKKYEHQAFSPKSFEIARFLPALTQEPGSI